MKLNKLLLLPFCFLLALSTLKAQVSIEADHADIRYWGRIDFGQPKAPAFEHSGVTIRAKFTGTSISARIHDYASHGATTTNYFYRIIDNGTPEKLEALSGDKTYVLARNLPSGTHTVELIKLTEAAVGKSAFLGFGLDVGAGLLPLDEPACHIEFIGNSITCGYGNEVNIEAPPTGNPTTGFRSVNENNYKAWGYVAARLLGMKYTTVCYSGRGVYRNNNGSTAGTIPAIYDRIYPDQTSSVVWDPASEHPSIIVIDLGTNDFAPDPSNPLSQSNFEAAYVNFVKKLKGYHPNAVIVLAVGVMMSDGYPSGAQHWTRIRAYVKNVVETVKNSGFTGVHYFEMDPQNPPYGEDWHPSAFTHTSMATNLATFVRSLNWDCSLTTGIVEKGLLADGRIIQMYPNPVGNELHLQYEGLALDWTITTVTGHEVLKGSEKSVSLPRLGAGLYHLSIGNQRFKFFKVQ